MSADTKWPQWDDTIVPAEWQAAPPVAPKRSAWAPVMNVTGICLAWALDVATSRPALNAVCLVGGIAAVAAWWPLH